MMPADGILSDSAPVHHATNPGGAVPTPVQGMDPGPPVASLVMTMEAEYAWASVGPNVTVRSREAPGAINDVFQSPMKPAGYRSP